MVLGAIGAGAVDVIEPDPNQTVQLSFDGGGHIEVTRGDLYDVARAFGLDPENCGPDDIEVRTVEAIALAHHLLGLKPEQFREVGLMLAQRQNTFREFDAARRLGGKTFDLQQILLSGLFNEEPQS